MSDERFEEWLRENADDFHRPPGDVPRDVMWETIAAARRDRPVAVIGRTWNGAWAPRAAAALLLVSLGVAAGYWLRGSATSRATSVATNTEPVADSVLTTATYEIVSMRHFTAAEALLTSFRSEAPSESDQALRRWARDLLVSTRLLMDSPAGADAARYKLLEDLEYVLAQIVQLAPDAPPADRTVVEESIGREQVLTRIRSTIPAGFPSGN